MKKTREIVYGPCTLHTLKEAKGYLPQAYATHA